MTSPHRARRATAFLLLSLLLSVGVAPGAAVAAETSARIVGVVRTLARPVAGVHVVVPAAGTYAVTDTAGRFELGPVGAGDFELHFAAVGYESLHGRIQVRAGETRVDAGSWLLKPARFDESATGAADARIADSLAALEAARRAEARLAQARLDDSLATLPRPSPVAPSLSFYLSAEEAGRWGQPDPPPDAPEARSFHELLRRMATADSITAVTAGTGAPGAETWRQWAERFDALAADSLLGGRPGDGPIARRAAAYAHSRWALVTGPTYYGYESAKRARERIAAAQADATAAGGSGGAFLEYLGRELDRVFVPGGQPPKPPPAAPAKKRKSRRKAG